MKHREFNSDYRLNFQVLEERVGEASIYPHREQLPVLLKALKHEFTLMLPARIAGVDERSNDFEKIQRLMAVDLFCHFVNGSRSDQLQLFGVLDWNRVGQVGIVQQVTHPSPRGVLHHFRFYAGEQFNTEIYCSGRRLRFTDHALKRFKERTPGRFGNELKSLLTAVYESPLIGMQCGHGGALVTRFGESIVALPYEDQGEHLIILSCLTVHEIHSLISGAPTYPFCLHYQQGYKVPPLRNWVPSEVAADLVSRWERKDRLPAPEARQDVLRWGELATKARDFAEEDGHGMGSRLVFLDNIPGPCSLMLRPGEEEIQHNELKHYTKTAPGHDWKRVLARRDKQLSWERRE